jgi:hypothetical protein
MAITSRVQLYAPRTIGDTLPRNLIINGWNERGKVAHHRADEKLQTHLDTMCASTHGTENGLCQNHTQAMGFILFRLNSGTRKTDQD